MTVRGHLAGAAGGSARDRQQPLLEAFLEKRE